MNSRPSTITLERAPETTYTQSASPFLYNLSYFFTSESNVDWFPLSEIILTIGKSKTIETYLKSAAHYHKFTVIVAESGPS